ncbi:MAG: hypothetical protein QOJ45_3 [Verrucomicrobiota bacterium]|jgi:excisionase family DNA binding protein
MPATEEVPKTSETPAPTESQPPALRSLQRELLSKQELALTLGVSPRTLDSWVAQKRIPFLRITPRLTKFKLDRVIAALDRYEVREVGATR